MMYFKSLFEGIHSLPNADSALRKKLDAELKENGQTNCLINWLN